MSPDDFIGFHALEAWKLSSRSRQEILNVFGEATTYTCDSETLVKNETHDKPSQLGFDFVLPFGALHVVVREPENVVEISDGWRTSWVDLSREGLASWRAAIQSILRDRGESAETFYARMDANIGDPMLPSVIRLAQVDTTQVLDLERLGQPPLEATTQVQPVYPQLAREARIDGTVIIAALVGRDGTVRDMKVVKSIPMLDKAALEAVSQFRFKPFVWQGKPASTWTRVPVTFALH